MPTKRDIINTAFEEIGLAEYAFDLQPQQIEAALRRLDQMMATWNGRGLRLGYPLPSSPANSDPDELLAVPDAALEAMALHLAIRIAPSYGKAVSPDTKANASSAYEQLLAQYAVPIEMQPNRWAAPAGAGAKHWRSGYDPFLRPPHDRIDAGPDSVLNIGDDHDDY